MPNTKGLDLLTMKKPPTAGEWHELIEARCSLIKPRLDSFTLRELGDLKCLRSEGSLTRTLRSDGPVVTGDKKFSLETQGIFHCPSSGVQTIPHSGFGGGFWPNGKKYIWGLTGDASWILAEVTFKGEAGYKDRGRERAQTVDMQKSDLITIIDATKAEPKEIWEELGEAVKEWVQSRERIYRQALDLGRMVAIEELLLSLIQGE